MTEARQTARNAWVIAVGLLEQLLKWMTIGAAALWTLAVVFVGSHLVPLVLGAAYAPVTRNLVPLTSRCSCCAWGAWAGSSR